MKKNSSQKIQKWKPTLGAQVLSEGGVSFCVWAPHAKRVEVKVVKPVGIALIPMTTDPKGYFHATVDFLIAGTQYFYVLDGKNERPDPASRYQPKGVHGPSEIVDAHSFRWKDNSWKGLDLAQYLIYELHVGTFTDEGTLNSAIRKIPYLKKLGITCVELMPLAQFPGARNWGYDGVNLFAVQTSYGGPEALKRFVASCHQAGLAVCLDVVYNHFGPEGNYLPEFAPYFTSRYHTPWGDAVNYDDRGSDEVRKFVIENALAWVAEYHIDALRLDAIHAICDFSAKHILQELKEAVEAQAQKLKRKVVVIAESDLNDPRIIQDVSKGGYGLDAQWSDDFHHSVHQFVTGEKNGYYADYDGLKDIALSLERAFVYQGQYSKFRQRHHGKPARGLKPEKFVIATQNHDQVGNRALGDRLSEHLSFEQEKLIAVLLLLSPNTPLLWMGQEYGELKPFHYFMDHGDTGLVKAVREGRRREFESFAWKGEMSDPKSKKTFEDSKLTWDLLKQKNHQSLYNLYRDLIKLRTQYYLKGKKIITPKIQVSFDAAKQWLACKVMMYDKMLLYYGLNFSKQTIEIPSLPKGHIFYQDLHTESRVYGGRLTGFLRGKRSEMILLPPESAVIGRLHS